MADHTLEAHFEMSDAAALINQRIMIQAMIIDRMANAALGGMLGANPTRDMMARQKATEAYAMMMAFFDGLAEAGIINVFKVNE
jgi:hypothetical protein